MYLIMTRRKNPVKNRKPEKNSGDQSDTKLIVVLVSAMILAILIIVAIVMTSYTLF